MKLAARFVLHCLRLRSLGRAMWVSAYENHNPHHGK